MFAITSINMIFLYYCSIIIKKKLVIDWKTRINNFHFLIKLIILKKELGCVLFSDSYLSNKFPLKKVSTNIIDC